MTEDYDIVGTFRQILRNQESIMKTLEVLTIEMPTTTRGDMSASRSHVLMEMAKRRGETQSTIEYLGRP